MRNPIRILCAAALLGLAANAVAQTSVPQARERIEIINGTPKKLTSKLVGLKKVLVAQFKFSYDHASARQENKRIFNLLTASDGIQFTYVDTVSQFTAPASGQYAVLVADNITNMGLGGIDNTKKLGIRNFVVGGGGIVMLHGSGDTRSATWAFYKDTLHPSIYSGEAVIGQSARVFQPATNTSLNTALGSSATVHPIMESIARDTTMQEEYHNFTNLISDVVPSATVLLSTDPASYTCNCTVTRPHPIIWTHKVARGTLVYAGPGHSTLATTSWGRPSPTDPRGPYWQRFLKQSLYYAAGYDTSDVVPIRGNVRDFNFAAGGIAFNQREMSVVFTNVGRHSIEVLDMKGRVLHRENGGAPKQYVFSARRFGQGVFVLKATHGRNVQTKRYFIGA